LSGNGYNHYGSCKNASAFLEAKVMRYKSDLTDEQFMTVQTSEEQNRVKELEMRIRNKNN